MMEWLEAPRHLALLEKGTAGPVQPGPAGSFRILMERKMEKANGAEQPAFLPIGISWGKTFGSTPSDISLDRLQLEVQQVPQGDRVPRIV